MIDLTRDDSPLKTNKVPHTRKATEKTPDPAQDISDVPPDFPKKIIQAKTTIRPRYSVTFDPIVDSRSPSPAVYHRNQSVFISRGRKETKRCKIEAIHFEFL
jgi:hypothetical protein